MRASSWLAAAAALPVLASCGFPPVTASGSPAIEKQARLSPVPGPDWALGYRPGAATPGQQAFRTEGGPREVVGLLESNAVSSLVIEPEEGNRIVLHVTPDTQLRIGDHLVGLREIQAGTEVRATYQPTNGPLDLAVEVTADPQSIGWSGRRHEPRSAKSH